MERRGGQRRHWKWQREEQWQREVPAHHFGVLETLAGPGTVRRDTQGGSVVSLELAVCLGGRRGLQGAVTCAVLGSASRSESSWVQSCSATYCMALGNLHDFSKPQFSPPFNGNSAVIPMRLERDYEYLVCS